MATRLEMELVVYLFNLNDIVPDAVVARDAVFISVTMRFLVRFDFADPVQSIQRMEIPNEILPPVSTTQAGDFACGCCHYILPC